MQCPFHGGKGYVVSTVLKDGTDAVGLCQAVAAYVDGVVTGEVFAETLRQDVYKRQSHHRLHRLTQTK